jgi:hypothetical protein
LDVRVPATGAAYAVGIVTSGRGRKRPSTSSPFGKFALGSVLAMTLLALFGIGLINRTGTGGGLSRPPGLAGATPPFALAIRLTSILR